MTINLQRFDLTTLRLYVAAVYDGSLTAGADRLGLSVAAASKRIVELENHIGVSLLERSKRGVVPTVAGRVLLPHAVEMVARLEQLAQSMSDVGSGTANHLRLWANTSAFCGFLPGLLARFARAHPEVVFDLEDATSEDAVRAVARGAAELAVIGDNTPTEGVETEICHVDELVLLLPRPHPLAAGGTAPVAFADVLDHDLVALPRSTSLTRQLAAEAAGLQRPLRIRAKVHSFDAMGRMVAMGLGLAVLPREGAMPCVRAFALAIRPLNGIQTQRRLLWAMRKRALLGANARSLIEMTMAEHS